MKRTFNSEDKRKAKLFEAWIGYLRETHATYHLEEFDEYYEGLLTVSEISRNNLGVHLDDGRRLRYLPVTSDIRNSTCRLDLMYVVLGLKKSRWIFLDVISVGSLVENVEEEGIHMTVNPIYAGEKENLGGKLL